MNNSRLNSISSALCLILKHLQSQPIGAAQICELELETCANLLRDVLQNEGFDSPDRVAALQQVQQTAAELSHHIAFMQAINTGLLARHTAEIHGYNAAGRPAEYQPTRSAS